MRTRSHRAARAWFILPLFVLCGQVVATPRVVRVGFPIIPGIYDRDAGGKRNGYFYELQELIAVKRGWSFEYVDATWDKCVTMLDSGEIDLLGFMGRDFTGDRLFDYNRESVLATWDSLLLRSKITYSGIESLQGITVALVRGRSETNEFLQLARAANTTIIPVYSDAADEQIATFVGGKTDAIVLSSHLLVALMKSGKYTDSRILFSPHAFGFAVKTGTNAALLDEIDLSLREVKERSPEILQLLKKRYLEPPVSYAIPAWLLILLAALALSAIIALVFIFMLRFQVKKHTLALTLQRDELRKLSEEAAAANEELESFSYSVSHDLRAPLRAIDGYSYFLQEKHSGELDEDGKTLIAKIRASTTKMDELIQSLLNLSRVGKTALKMEDIDMAAMARSAIAETESDETRSSFEILVEPLPPVRGDATLLRQVWINLLSNAFKYSMKSPRRRIEISGAVKNGECLYSVKDSGAGFDQAYAGRLFGVFQRLHSAAEYPGTGIGLATVQRIVHRHGGSVSAEGKLGEGAVFHFSIPIRLAEPRA